MNAQINLSLGNAQEVIQQLRQILGMMQGVNTGASVPTGPAAPMSGSTGLGQGVNGPPVPMTSPVHASGAAMAAGTPMVGQATGSVQMAAAAASNGAAFAAASSWGSPYTTFMPGRGMVPLGIDPMANRYVDMTTGGYMLGVRPGIGQGSGGPGQPGAGAMGMGQMLGGAAAYHQLTSLGGQAVSGYGHSLATNTPYTGSSLLPAAVGLGWTAAGAMIGSAIPGVGTLVGAGIGSLVGGLHSQFLQPLIDRDLTNERFAQSLRAIHGGHSNFRKWAMDRLPEFSRVVNGDFRIVQELEAGLSSGYEIGFGSGAAANDLPDALRTTYLQALRSGQWSPGQLKKYGAPRLGDRYDASRETDALMAEAWDNPAVGNIIRSRGGDGADALADRALSIFKFNKTSEDDLAGMEAENSFAQSRAARYGSASDVGGLSGSINDEATLIEQRAAYVAAKYPGRARAMRVQAASKRMSQQELYFSTLTSEVNASGGLASGDAQRAILTDTYSGKRFDKINFGAASTAASTQAAGLEMVMEQRRKAGMLGAAEEAMMTNQIRSLRFQADVEIPRGAEQMRNSTLMGETGFRNASNMAKNIGRYTYGSATEQAGVYDEQVKALKEQASTLKEILETSKYLSYEQKLQLQTQVKQLEVETVRTERAGLSARASAQQATTNVQLTESTVAPSLALVRGAGGFQAYGAKIANVAASQGRLAAAQTRMQALMAGGASYDDPEVQGLREQIANMKIGVASEEQDLANVPMSGKQRAKMSTLQAETALMRMGYGGTAGGIRGNLMRQIAIMGERASDLTQTEAALRMRQGGTLTDEQQARFAEQRSDIALHAAGLQAEYDEGYDQRLISRAYNMPSQGRLVMSGFTRRESAFSGVYNRLFGGSLEQTRRMRIDTPARLHAMLSSGNPIGMEDAAMKMGGGYVGSNGGPIQVEGKVTVTVQTDQGKVIGQSEAWVKQVDQFFQRFNLANDEGKAGGF